MLRTGAPDVALLVDEGMSEPGSSDETRLVLLAQADDQAALEALFGGVESALLRYISGLVGHEGAEDVLQEVFVKLWRNLRWLHDPKLFRPWAYRIASRSCFDFLRRQRRWSEQLDAVETVENIPAPMDTSGLRLLGGLEALLEKVSPASRAVLLLHYGQDLPIEDVAGILDIDVGTAKSRLAYGLACLRKSLQRKDELHAGATARSARQRSK